MDIVDIKSQKYSFLGENCLITGNLKLSGQTMISSSIDGDIMIEDKSNLQIERSGFVKGSIYCHNLSIYGKVQGIIESTGKITIHSTAKVEGKITAECLKIYPGALVNIEGHSE